MSQNKQKSKNISFALHDSVLQLFLEKFQNFFENICQLLGGHLMLHMDYNISLVLLSQFTQVASSQN